VLLALADVFSVDIKDLSGNEDDRLLADLSEALADPLFAGDTPPAQDLKLVVQNTPAVAHAFLSMHQALRRAGERLAELDDTLERTGAQTDPTPYEEVRDFFHYMDNYVDWLDRAAEDLAGQLDAAAPTGRGRSPASSRRSTASASSSAARRRGRARCAATTGMRACCRSIRARPPRRMPSRSPTSWR
jgi:hypothetical protein